MLLVDCIVFVVLVGGGGWCVLVGYIGLGFGVGFVGIVVVYCCVFVGWLVVGCCVGMVVVVVLCDVVGLLEF